MQAFKWGQMLFYKQQQIQNSPCRLWFMNFDYFCFYWRLVLVRLRITVLLLLESPFFSTLRICIEICIVLKVYLETSSAGVNLFDLQWQGSNTRWTGILVTMPSNPTFIDISITTLNEFSHSGTETFFYSKTFYSRKGNSFELNQIWWKEWSDWDYKELTLSPGSGHSASSYEEGKEYNLQFTILY